MNNQAISECPKCGAKWIDGQLYWSTGALGDPHDLAGLVCNNLGDETCINPCKGSTSGDSWESRFEGLKTLLGEEEE
jgi:hypothetical protein